MGQKMMRTESINTHHSRESTQRFSLRRLRLHRLLLS